MLSKRVLAHISLIAAILATACVYYPGLRGGFLFDDFANLSSLGATGPIDNAPALARYLTSGTADPTGRPVSVASFLLDARDWPADPRPFKLTNLLIHLLNTLLLARLLLTLGRLANVESIQAHYAAVLGSALWALHPFFVSTTLYIVQREAMLPVSFTLTGLLLWLAGRERLIRGRIASGLLLELAGLGLGTLLATLSKANGILLPFYALLLEYLLLRPNDSRNLPRAHRVVVSLLWLPVIAVIAYLLHSATILIGGPPPYGRSWTLDQRLMTEPRVLWDYLRLLWLPHPFTPGLFNDQVQVSTGWLKPWSTLPALLGTLGLIAAALRLRHRWPLWSLAILFFFTGHLIESTTLPLELYFEHRNYLPALLMFWPLAVYLLAPGKMLRARVGLILIILCGLGSMTYANARVWGNTEEQAILWAQLNPESPRAQSYAAEIVLQRQQPDRVQARLRPLLKLAPDEIQIAFNLLSADCRLGSIPLEDLDATRRALMLTPRLSEFTSRWFGQAITLAKAEGCHGLTYPSIQSLLDAAWNNPAMGNIPTWKQDILNLKGKLALSQGHPELAYQYLGAAFMVNGSPAVALEQAATLGTAGQQKLALCQLELWEARPTTGAELGWSMSHLHGWVLQRQNYWPNEVVHLKQALSNDMPAEQHGMTCPVLALERNITTIQHAE